MGSPNSSSTPPYDGTGRPAGSTCAPRLENGDRLTRADFERRYESRPDLKKAELIEGVICMPPLTCSGSHARPHASLVGWLFAYVASTPGVQLNDNPTIRLDLDNEPQPDVALLIVWPHAGCTRRFVGECKVRGDGLERTVREGVEQTRGCMDRCGAEAGHLIVFDRSETRTWEEKIFRCETPAHDGAAPVTVWGM